MSLNKQFSGRVAIFLDVSNIYYSQQTLGWDIDYKKLIKWFKSNTTLTSAYFYTGIDRKNVKQQRFLEKMTDFGYIVKQKEIKWIRDKNSKLIKGKGNLDIELALDFTHKADTYDTGILISGDSDFEPAVQMVKALKKQVIVISTRGHIARELIQVSDRYIPFEKLRTILERKKSPRTKRGKSSASIVSKVSKEVK